MRFDIELYDEPRIFLDDKNGWPIVIVGTATRLWQQSKRGETVYWGFNRVQAGGTLLAYRDSLTKRGHLYRLDEYSIINDRNLLWDYLPSKPAFESTTLVYQAGIKLARYGDEVRQSA